MDRVCPKPPCTDVEPYSARWAIETGHARITEFGAKTRMTGAGARTLCFYPSPRLLGEWTVARTLVSGGTDGQSGTSMPAFKACPETPRTRPGPPLPTQDPAHTFAWPNSKDS